MGSSEQHEVYTLRDYDLIYIISPEIGEESVPATVEKVSKLVAERGGAVEGVEQWGKRKLAYPINRFTEGSYVSTRIKLSPAEAKGLEANLKLTEEVIRHLLVKIGD
jgi:small subunit ribosomal protein S6